MGSIDWFKGKITGKSHHFMGKSERFPEDFTVSQPIDSVIGKNYGENVEVSEKMDSLMAWSSILM